MSRYRTANVAALICAALATTSTAQDAFMLSSPEVSDGGMLPPDLKCSRDGGDGLSPPLVWKNVPSQTQSLAVIMHHYPRGAIAGRDAPSQYWLLWNIPKETRGVERGNPLSIGAEGADKDERHTGYTPPCSPPGSAHEYTITVYALNVPLSNLPVTDDISIDWQALTSAMDGKIIASSGISFKN